VREASADEVEAALAAAPRPAWAAAAGRARARLLDAPPTRWRRHARAAGPLLVREAGKTCANAVAEVREAVDFLRYYAARCARLRQRHPPAAGPGGVHQPVELPAGHLHRPGGRGAGRRQRGAGQAGRADAAGRRRGGALLHEAGVPRARCSCCPAAARPWAPRWWPMPRVQGVLFTGSTEVARLMQRTLAAAGRDGQPCR
jgi:RHH-type transcriptional regulator, proline utilization regulon repressor / proline dehydrogenase / delta 1-pyrroline-5-carboxylate dehydrogenase